jgi:trehalose-6-phosphate synthase
MASRAKQVPKTQRLIVVSNRLPVTVRRGPAGPERIRTTGGLVAALAPPLERRAGVWIGWPGTELRPGERVTDASDPYRIIPVALGREQVKRFYYGFSNRTLWPLLHTMPGRAVFHSADWATYRDVNRRFARIAARRYQRGDQFWVNDYQLMLMPAELRATLPAAPIGFFLHIPFPPYDVFRLLPWAKPLLKGILSADLIGFHVRGYVRNFLDCAERLLEAKVDRRSRTVTLDGRTTAVGAFPLGIDFAHLHSLAEKAPQSGIAPQRLVLGVDRLDYTKGIPQRIRAFAQLLDSYPEHRQRITLLQIAVPSRAEVAEYQ